MDDITVRLTDILEKYGCQNITLFQQQFDEFLSDIKERVDRQTVYNMIISIPNNHLSNENSDYLADVVTDIRGHTARIYYRFKDDPQINNDEFLAYVRNNLWKRDG